MVTSNACVCFVPDVPPRASVTPFCTSLGLMSASNRCNYFTLIVVFKMIQMEFPLLLARAVNLVPNSFRR